MGELPPTVRHDEPWLAIVWDSASGDLEKARRLWVELESELAVRQRALGVTPAPRETCDELATTSIKASIEARSATVAASHTTATVTVENDGRYLYGIAVPYGQPAIVIDSDKVVAEKFDSQSIPHAPEGLPLLAGHRRDTLAVGRVIAWDNRPDGLHFHARLLGSEPDVEGHRDRIRHGINAVSIGFYRTRTSTDEWQHDGHSPAPTVLRRNIKLDHLALVNDPAYVNARVHRVSIRRATPGLDEFAADPVMSWAAERLHR